MITKKNIFYSVVALLIIIGTAGTFKETSRFEIVKSLDIFSDLFTEVNNLYVEEIQAEKLIKEGIDGMLESLDPYTVYYPESEIEDYKLMTTGQYGGIGARISRIDDQLFIRELFKSSPSLKAGVQVGDVIKEVDGNVVKEQTPGELSKLLKGTPGTELTIKLQRRGEEIIKTFKREEIKISSVPFYGMIDDEIGYIKLTSFTRQVSEEVKKAFIELSKNKGMKKLVFDLRSNPGGLLLESINIVNLFTKKGELVVETKGKIESWNKQYKNLNSPEDTEIPIIVLVNGGSASASEIVSGALQDIDRAVVIGKNTYGKGLVQTTVKLKYNSSLKVTTAKYYIPSGRCIQEINYAKKDKFGKAMKIVDSLRVSFKTKNGRLVEDGHGIQPDLELKNENIQDVSRELLKKHYVFKFVNNYVSTITEDLSIKTFKVSDSIFYKFIDFIKEENFVYTSSTEKLIKKVLKQAKKDELETYVKADLNKIVNNLNKGKIDEIIKYKNEIKRIIKSEILSRYYYRQGRIENSLRTDSVVIKSCVILKNDSLYKSYLTNSTQQ